MVELRLLRLNLRNLTPQLRNHNFQPYPLGGPFRILAGDLWTPEWRPRGPVLTDGTLTYGDPGPIVPAPYNIGNYARLMWHAKGGITWLAGDTTFASLDEMVIAWCR